MATLLRRAYLAVLSIRDLRSYNYQRYVRRCVSLSSNSQPSDITVKTMVTTSRGVMLAHNKGFGASVLTAEHHTYILPLEFGGGVKLPGSLWEHTHGDPPTF